MSYCTDGAVQIFGRTDGFIASNCLVFSPRSLCVQGRRRMSGVVGEVEGKQTEGSSFSLNLRPQWGQTAESMARALPPCPRFWLHAVILHSARASLQV